MQSGKKLERQRTQLGSILQRPARQHGLKSVSKGSKLDLYKPQMDECMAQGIFNCVVLRERLWELGYDGGMSIVKTIRSSPHRSAKTALAVRRYETPSGVNRPRWTGHLPLSGPAGQATQGSDFRDDPGIFSGQIY